MRRIRRQLDEEKQRDPEGYARRKRELRAELEAQGVKFVTCLPQPLNGHTVEEVLAGLGMTSEQIQEMIAEARACGEA